MLVATKKLECPRCRGAMEAGFMIDRGDYSYPQRQNWVEGQPEKSFWHGFQTKGKEVLAVETWRCGKCGYLESYANEPASTKQ